MVFDNKYIDYSSKSKRELYETLLLFLLLSNKNLVFIGKYLLKFALLIKLPIFGIIKKTIFKHFCGGENINEAKRQVLQLGKHNIQTILDYSIEGTNKREHLQKTYNEIIKTIEMSHNNNLIPFCVFKISGIARFDLLKKINQNEQLDSAEEEEIRLVKERLSKICEKAKKYNVPILIDAEESWIQDSIDALVENLMWKFNKNKVLVYNTIQLYRWDRLHYLKETHKKGKNKKCKLGFKLVRGAYMEKERNRAKLKNYPSPIHETKKKCDIDYNTAAKYCIQHINDMALCFGTHNETSTHLVMQLMKKNKIKNNDSRFYFSQLLGMSDNISFYLGQYNYNVAKYVPYGPVKDVIPYLIRRAEENSAITSQSHQEIKRLKKAIKN